MSSPFDSPIFKNPELLPPNPYATATVSGGRKWVYPKRSEGRFWDARRLVAVLLVGVFTALPHIKINGMPSIWLDIPARRFTLFGTQFWATDTLFLALLLLSIAITIVALTAIFGRIWCGWGCPQTVYMEFVFRPLEALIEGQSDAQRKLNAGPWTAEKVFKKGLKWTLFAGVAALMAHTFLAYFVSVDELEVWMTRSPIEHPFTFFVMVGVTGLILVDFGWFREQMCTIACPYGRLQSVMMDPHSLRVGYDFHRGEPRGKLQKSRPSPVQTATPAQVNLLSTENPASAYSALKEAPAVTGDCVDCKRCVVTCPTGIDIRNGLQLECIGCTQCIDACDDVMDKIGKPRGLIRFTTTAILEGKSNRFVRPRLFVYAGILLVLITALTYKLETRDDTTVNLLRAQEQPYVLLPDGRISNHLKLKVSNRSAEARNYTLTLTDKVEASVVIPLSPLPVVAGDIGQTDVIVMLSPKDVPAGNRSLTFTLTDDRGQVHEVKANFVGPAHP